MSDTTRKTALWSCATLAILTLTACLHTPPLELKKVVLYQNGIGYFERQGTFDGDRLRLRLRTHELNDVLKSLTVIDRRGGNEPKPVTAVVPAQESAAGKKLDGHEGVVWLDIHLGHKGVHDLLISYSVPTPAWKATYRLVLPEVEGDERDQALIQGWALINNASGEDWTKVALTLATGAPMTFAMDMRTPRFVARPDLSGRMIQPVVTGAVMSESARPGDLDGDGIPDERDRCPNEPEDKDGFEDEDGCPDPDNDNDRILDVDDQCPNEPENYNGYEDEDGCPDKGRVVVHKSRIVILDKIYFAAGSATVTPISMPIINAIAATLKGNPQITAIEVMGHASPVEAEIWALSARRAGAVRSTLKELGVKTEMQVRAYGATQPVATEEGEEQQARNRRVEFKIVRLAEQDREAPVDPAPTAALGSVTPQAAQRSVHRGAQSSEVAGMTRYLLPGEVSIEQGTTTMVTVINRRISGQEVFLYRPDPNVPGSDSHPQRAARIENSGELTLEPGPMTIFARGTIVGEGLLSRLHPKQTAFIPFAVDGSAAVRVSSSAAAKPVKLVSLIDGVATVEDHSQRVTRYEVETGSQVPGLMVVKHPRWPEYELIDLPPGTSTTATAVLIPFPIDASSRSVLTVKELKPVRRTISIWSGGTAGADQLQLYLENVGALGEVGQKTLSEVISAQRKVARLAEEQDRQRARIADIGLRSGELRASLKAVARTHGGAGLRRKLLSQLTETSSQMDRATRDLTATSLKLAAARDALKRLATSLRIPAAGKK